MRHKKYTIEEVRDIFRNKGYTLLSDIYTNNSKKLEYICPIGHEGSINLNNFLLGHGCYKCNIDKLNNHRRLPYQKIKEYIEKEGYYLLVESEDYKNGSTLITLKCPEGHTYKTRYNNFRGGSRCPICHRIRQANNQRLSIEEVRKRCESRGFTLLENTYNKSDQKMLFQCKNGHQIEMLYSNIARGVGCKLCYNERIGDLKRYPYEFVKNKIETMGYMLLSEKYYGSKSPIECLCPEGHSWRTSLTSINNGHRCYSCFKKTSRSEQEIYEFVKSLFSDTEHTNRKLITPLELDIVVPSKKLAIEFCGLFWHSETQGKDRNYHLHKLELCNNIGYDLITIFEDEWANKKDIVKSVLINKLGLSDGIRIGGRSCTIDEIDIATAKSFCEKYHLQGYLPSVVRLGASHQGNLISLMTFSKPSLSKGFKGDKDGHYELSRFCTNLGYIGSGIASRLLNTFEAVYAPKTIISFSDKRWFQGDLYKYLGFRYVYDTKPNYYYIDKKQRLHRFGFRKSELCKKLATFDPKLSEYQNMANNGYDRIWDCGHKKFVKEIRSVI